VLAETFPDDGVLGEEGAARESRTGRRWIIDPIDGTRDFLRGNRFWATLIGLEAGGEVQVGVAAFPALGETYHAVQGGGAWQDGVRLQASSITTPAEAVVCVNGLNNLEKTRLPEPPGAWLKRFWAVRSIGGAADAMLVASGRAELWIEPAAKPWDLAPLKIIAEEAGARFFNFQGGSSIHGGNCIICAPGLEEEARRLVGSPR
jgi:fructose-1,6-bisphosphatase/inositol monophosphatase family enzyme